METKTAKNKPKKKVGAPQTYSISKNDEHESRDK